jgi:hypothetical protein
LERTTSTSGTTLPSGKTYFPTKSSNGGFGVGSVCAFKVTTSKETMTENIIFFMTAVFIEKEN